jgi:hypothetical protein
MAMHEQGFEVALSHYESGYTAGRTISRDFNLVPSTSGSIIVRAGLSHCVAIEPAGGATIGISGIHGEQFSAPAQWKSAVYFAPGRSPSFTISAHVFRGEMRGWWYIQAWS